MAGLGLTREDSRSPVFLPQAPQFRAGHAGAWYGRYGTVGLGKARRGRVTRMSTQAELLERITARQDVFGGKPIIRDMRISVRLILSLLSQGVSQEDILDDYPELEPDDIRACIAYACAVISGDTLASISVDGSLDF